LVQPPPFLPGQDGRDGSRPVVRLRREALVAALGTALGQPGPRRLACLADLDGDGEQLGLGPLTPMLADTAGQQRLKEALAQVARLLGELASSGSPQQRGRALSLLGRIGAAGSGELVEQACDDADPWLREAAARTAGRLHLPRLAPALSRLLAEDPAWAVRAAAARSLGQLGHEASAELLVRATGDGFAFVREASAAALGMLERPQQAVVPLLELLRDPIPSVRAAAAGALGRLQVRSAGPALKALDADAHHLVREAAREAMARIRG
ncbi:MAG: HEAT repeat domain-containing protein, partial [Deltaproteobacteria bacterium]|nr:HEAT repeat domain-containing protein [Deltaproteobacteria bacterium]